jgi:hypothetical protein
MTDTLRCDTSGQNCFYDCDYIFGDPVVLPSRTGGTMVQWVLNEAVRDEGEYVYTLQTGNAGVADNKAWTDVVTEPNVCFLIDDKQRLHGAYSFTHYRLKLQTDERTYYSKPLHTMGHLNYADWRQYESIMRAEQIMLSRRTGINGVLLKRKISGIPCKRCRDFNTGEVRDAACKFCYGTGWFGGYYNPVPCVWFNVDPIGSTIKHDTDMQGPVIDTHVVARAVASPILVSGDVWVNLNNSERFKILQIQNVVEVKSVPVVYRLGMERLTFSDIAYSVPVSLHGA